MYKILLVGAVLFLSINLFSSNLIQPCAYAPYETLMSWYEAKSGNQNINEDGGGIWDLAQNGSVLYIGFGNGWPSRQNGAGFARFDLNNPCGSLVYLGNLDEQGFGEMLVADNGNVIITGEDPAYGDDWSAGNVYLWDGQKLQKIRNRYATPQLVGRVKTNAEGYYCFKKYKATDYDVKVIPPDGYKLTQSTISSSQNAQYEAQLTDRESDALTSSGIINLGGPNTSLGTGVAVYSNCAFNDYSTNAIDAGIVIGSSNIVTNNNTANRNIARGATNICGSIWYDTNGNGIQEIGESGVHGVEIELYTSDPIFPFGIHSRELWKDPITGYIYVTMQWDGSVYESKDNGVNWYHVFSSCEEFGYEHSIHGFSSYGGEFTFILWDWTNPNWDLWERKLIKRTIDGEYQRALDVSYPTMRQYPIYNKEQIFVLGGSNSYLNNMIFEVGGNVVNSYNLPSDFIYSTADMDNIIEINDIYYMLINFDERQVLVKTKNFSFWEIIHDFGSLNGCINSIYPSEQNSILCSTRCGQQANVIKLNLEELQTITRISIDPENCLDENIASIQNDNYILESTKMTSSSIQPSENRILRSENMITLEPGFQVSQGSNYRFEIDECKGEIWDSNYLQRIQKENNIISEPVSNNVVSPAELFRS